MLTELSPQVHGVQCLGYFLRNPNGTRLQALELLSAPELAAHPAAVELWCWRHAVKPGQTHEDTGRRCIPCPDCAECSVAASAGRGGHKRRAMLLNAALF